MNMKSIIKQILRNNLNRTLLILFFCTLITTLLGEKDVSSSIGYFMICAIIFIKGSLVILEFMELKSAPSYIYIPMLVYVLLFSMLIFIMSFF